MFNSMFNSRDPIFRNPTGAVPQGTSIHFKINPPRDIQCTAVYLIVGSDSAPSAVYNMFWCGMEGSDSEWWECDYTPPTTGLYFYHFELKTQRGHKNIYQGVNGKVISDYYGKHWQITVYEKDFDTPDWLSGGIIYQIFPDRFNYSGIKKNDVPKDREIRDKWNEKPHWKPNDKGIVTNNDYFMGDLKGITQKLSYLQSLSVTCIYLNPIFEAHSNHRYNTADYSKIDPLLGSEDDFEELCKKADELGIKVIIDGVFNHTGSDSIYFNREERYKSLGAYNSKDSQYYKWFNFSSWPNHYDSWWNFDTLPNIDENNSEYSEFITGKEGIIRKWIKKGAAGWRLDVADELPDTILDKIYSAAKAENKDSLVMGEVWEDASTKMAYGIRRRYLIGHQMDTVMNYPFRDAIIRFLTGDYSSLCMEQIENIVENYPPQCLRLLMNHIGTHDTERAITVLAGAPTDGNDREWQSKTKLSPEQYLLGVSRLKLATLLQFTLPGIPSIYYGDEAGVQGYKDPFNRSTYPWNKENEELLKWYAKLGNFRKKQFVFKNGSLRNVYSYNNIMSFERYDTDENGEKHIIFIAINRSETPETLPIYLYKKAHIAGTDSIKGSLLLPAYSYSVLSLSEHTKKV